MWTSELDFKCGAISLRTVNMMAKYFQSDSILVHIEKTWYIRKTTQSVGHLVRTQIPFFRLCAFYNWRTLLCIFILFGFCVCSNHQNIACLRVQICTHTCEVICTSTVIKISVIAAFFSNLFQRWHPMEKGPGCIGNCWFLWLLRNGWKCWTYICELWKMLVNVGKYFKIQWNPKISDTCCGNEIELQGHFACLKVTKEVPMKNLWPFLDFSWLTFLLS